SAPSALSALLPTRRSSDLRTWEGALAGVVMAGAVAIGMYALGGMQVHGLATRGAALWLSALPWLVANICIGVAVGFWYRPYILQDRKSTRLNSSHVESSYP